MKKILYFIVIALILISSVLLVGCSSKIDYEQEIINNSNLEQKSEGWTYFTDDSAKVTYTETVLSPGTTDYESDSAKHGRTYIGIDSKSAGSYGYFSQEVSLDKNAVYILSVDVKVTTKISTEGSLGAFVGLAEANVIAQSVTALSSEWQTIQICFRNNSFDKVNVRFGLGTDSSKVTSGYAYFDNVSLKKIENPDVSATGLIVYDLGKKGTNGFSQNYLTTGEGIAFTVVLVVVGAAVMYGLYVWYRRNKSLDLSEVPEEVEDKSKAKAFFTSSAFLIAVSALIAFAVRFVLSITLYGHGDALNKLTISANGFATDGLITYYFTSETYYTPGVSYVLWIMGLLAKAFGLLTGSKGMAIFIKIPAIVADLIIVFVLYVLANKKLGSVRAFIISLAYALVPAVFIASSVYCSYYSIGILFLILALVNAREKKIVKLTVYYTLSVLFMAESLWIFPLLVAYAVVIYIKDPDKRNVLPISATVSLISSYLLTLTLSFNYFATGRPFIVLERYCTIFSVNKYFTDGAFNIYAMCGQSGVSINTAGVVMSALLSAIGLLYCICLYAKSRDRQQLILLAGYSILLVFTFSVRMNPLVTIIALSILYLYAVMSGDRKVLTSTASLSVIATLSMCYELMICKYVPGGANAQEIAVSTNDPVAIIFSIVWVAITLYLGSVVWNICINKKGYPVLSIDKCYFKYVGERLHIEKENKITEE